MRGLPGALLAIWFATSSGCAARPQVLVADSARVTVMNVESLTAQYPLGRTENIKSAPLARTAALSTHFVQIRDREAPHAHARHDLVVTVLRGKGNIYVRGVPTRMRAGDVAVIPRGTPHYFVNTGNDPAAALATFAPPFDGTDQVPVAD